MGEPKETNPQCEQPWVGDLTTLVQFAEGGIVSKTLVDCEKANISLFCMATGQKMSGHSSKWAATIQVVSGVGKIQIAETEHEGRPGSLYYMPARTYHALDSTDNLVFLLNLFR
jgi:quercetin dioxygenase-like cupin family protein